MDEATKSYCAAIMIANGSQQWERFAVTSNDRFYLDLIQPIFGTKVCANLRRGKTSYRIRSVAVTEPSLDDITSPVDFIRGWAELKGAVSPITQHVRSGKRHVPGFRIWGPMHVMEYIMSHAPIAPKKINTVTNSVEGGAYTGTTYEIRLQMRETEIFLDYITGYPCNPAVWDLWESRINHIRGMDKNEEGEK